MSQRRPNASEAEGLGDRFRQGAQWLGNHSVGGIVGGVTFAAVAWISARSVGWLGGFGDWQTGLALACGLIVGIAIGGWFQNQRTRTRQTMSIVALDDADRLLRLDQTLFRHLLLLAEGKGDEQAIRGVIYEVLQNIVAFFGDDVVRGTVFRPSADALCAWVGYLMPQDSLERLRFPFNSAAGAPSGVALQAYRTKKIQFERMTKLKSGRWKASSQNYVVHDAKRNRPPYSVFVAIPLMFENRVIGVLCLDSMNADAFVKGRDEEKLTAIALRVSAPLAVYDSLTMRS